MINEELLIRVLTKTCTQEDLLEIEQWISEEQANADWLFDIEHTWSLKNELYYTDQLEIEAAYNRFVNVTSQKESKRAVRRQLYQKWMKYVAAIIIVCLLSTNIYQIIRYNSFSELTTNTIEVPIGQRVAVTLGDGTKVWLNSGSVLSYPTTFDRKERTVSLDGEGYFEVTASKEAPFIVNTSMLKVKVLGTKFNLQAYTEDENTTVALIEGQLQIQTDQQSALMAPNELISYSEHNGLAHLKNKKVQHMAKWTTGELIFVDERLADIAKTLERYFDINIIINSPELADECFSCRTQSGATLEQVLTLLKNTKKMDYTIQNKKVQIKKK